MFSAGALSICDANEANESALFVSDVGIPPSVVEVTAGERGLVAGAVEAIRGVAAGAVGGIIGGTECTVGMAGLIAGANSVGGIGVGANGGGEGGCGANCSDVEGTVAAGAPDAGA